MHKKHKLSSIQILRLLSISMILLFLIIAIWGKTTLSYINDDKLMESTMYSIYKEEELPFYSNESNISFLDKKETTLKQLIHNSEHVVIVRPNKYKVSGNGLLASVTVEKVIKGEELKENDVIQIYDMILYTNINADLEGYKSIEYVESNLPMKKKDQYIVFLQKAINPVEKGAYMYSSLRYGNFRITNQPNIYTAYDSYDKYITLKDAMEYDVICTDDINEVELKLYQEIFDTYH